MGRAVIVRLTHRQWDAVMGILDNGWLIDWVLDEGRIKDEGKKLEVLQLPDVWLAVADELIQTHFTTGSIRKVSAPLFDGVRRIVKQTNARQEHPAFAGVALEGRQFEVLPAWEWWPPAAADDDTVARGGRFVPFIPELRHSDETRVASGCGQIDPNYALCSLWPEHKRRGGVVFTEWHHSTMRTTGPISTDAYDRFIKARPAVAGSPK